MEGIRWNNFTRVYPVRFEDEPVPKSRDLRLCSPALRVGDPVKVSGELATIVDVVSAVVVVRREA